MSNNNINVNWSKLKKMGENTLKNSAEFEEARNKFQEIVNSLPECWEGIDSDAYRKSCNHFLTELKNDTLYLQALGEFFNFGSDKYNKVVSDNAEKVKKINETLEEEKEKYAYIEKLNGPTTNTNTTGVI